MKTVLFLGAAVACLFISNFEIVAKDKSVVNTILNLFGYIIIVIHFAQTLWHKYYVSYNKKAITIRLNRNILEERTFQFKHLKHVVLKGNSIYFDYRNKEEFINLDGFEITDINRIHTLLNQSL